MERFSEWLVTELRSRDMSPADLSRLTGLTPSAISRLISSNRKPSAQTMQSIANGLKISVEEIYQVAGILPPSRSIDDLLDKQILLSLGELDQDDKHDILAIINAKIERKVRLKK